MKHPYIAIGYELMGMSADSIIDENPHLRLEHVHDALSCYYEHKDMKNHIEFLL